MSLSPDEFKMECSKNISESNTATVAISDADRNLMAREMQATIGGTDPVDSSAAKTVETERIISVTEK